MSVTLREALQQIYDDHGKLTPAIVVQAASHTNHPLHSRFEWDDRVAGEAWRRAQAQELIRSVKIVYRQATETEEARSVRAYHAVRGKSGYAYQPAEVIATDPFLKRLLLNDMRREWLALRRRYERFEEFSAMIRQDLDEKAA